jgi:hypothetical protein
VRAVSVLTVADDAVFGELSQMVSLPEHLGERVGEGWVVGPTFEREIIPRLRQQGVPVLIRMAKRAAGGLLAEDLAPRLRHLTSRAREVLHSAQRHAIDGMVVGIHAWDPELDAPAVRELLGLGLLEKLGEDGPLEPREPGPAAKSSEARFTPAGGERGGKHEPREPGPAAKSSEARFTPAAASGGNRIASPDEGGARSDFWSERGACERGGKHEPREPGPAAKSRSAGASDIARTGRDLRQRVASEGGKHAIHPELPPPPEIPYDFHEAAMPEPEDLGQGKPGPLGLLHDLASLAAAIDLVAPKRTLAGLIGAVDSRKLQDRLCTPRVARLEEHPRWGQALRALEALGVVTLDPTSRELGLDLGLERTLMGSTEQALDHLVHRLVDADLHSALPAVRAALRSAGDGAVDEVVFYDLLAEQHREVLFTPWRRGSVPTYPALEGEHPRQFDRDTFDEVEVPMLHRLLGRLDRLGLVRRAPGVFAGTPDGRRWGRVEGQPLPPIWVSSDLELVVPPDGLTPWERFQVERLGRCLARDVVDRYRLERAGVETWLRHHEIDEALALLERRSPAVPDVARQTLLQWAKQASRVVVTRGVILT